MRRIASGYQGAAVGIITVLEILTGLSAFGSKLVIFIGIVVAGVADAFANAAGIHVLEEIERLHERKEVWKSTLYAFLATLLVFISLALPILFFEFYSTILISWLGAIIFLILLGTFVEERTKGRLKLIVEHVGGGMAISALCFVLGSYVMTLLG